MRVSHAEKEKTHARIVASAARLLRERGIDGASVADVMKDAGLTHGGFYKHFANKDALVESAVEYAFAPYLAMLRSGEADAGTHYRQLYLSADHVDNPGQGCPVAALAQDISRGSSEVRNSLAAGIDQVVTALADTMTGDSPAARRQAALQQFSMQVGAVIIARATDDAMSDEVLAAVSAALAP